MTTISPSGTGSPLRIDAAGVVTTKRTTRQWVFFGKASLPSDPQARRHEKRGRRWLVLSYLMCPCHVPITLTLVGAAFGGSAFGAAITGNALRVGIVLTTAYAVALSLGFRQIRRAKRIEAAGGSLRCAPDGCTVTSPPA